MEEEVYNHLKNINNDIKIINYVWVDTKSDRALTRFQTQKSTISKLFDDVDLSHTEKQIMIEHGYVQVFDSGTDCWIWKS